MLRKVCTYLPNMDEFLSALTYWLISFLDGFMLRFTTDTTADTLSKTKVSGVEPVDNLQVRV